MFTFSYKKKLKTELKNFLHTVHYHLDLIPDADLQKVAALGLKIEESLKSPISKDVYRIHTDEIATLAEAVLPRVKMGWLGDILDVLVVALMVAMGVRGLFIQPFKIPTGSMQPTLFGIHYMRDEGPQGSPVLRDFGSLLNGFLYGVSRAEFTAPFDCTMGSEKPQVTFSEEGLSKFGLIRKFGLADVCTRFYLTGYDFETQSAQSTPKAEVVLPGEPDKLAQYMSLGDRDFPGNIANFGPWHKGDTLAKGYLSTGDNLFVDRLTHHFTGLKRGDIIVFNTENIYEAGRPLSEKGFYYIKRLVGLPGDTLRVRGNVLEVKEKGSSDFVPIEQLDSRFEKLYSGRGGYHGHLPWRDLANRNEIEVPEGSYFAMGDNSRSSSDSRYWGVVPRANIVGRPAFIFWPFSKRWGSADPDASTLSVESDWNYESIHTADPSWSGRPLPAMSLQ